MTNSDERTYLIPDEAVLAAAEAVYGCGFDGSPQKDAWLRDFREALAAAAPHMLAEAEEAGYNRALADIISLRPTSGPKPYVPTSDQPLRTITNMKTWGKHE